MIGLIFATEREAAPFLARAGITPCRAAPAGSDPMPADPQVARVLRARADARTASAFAICPCAERPGHRADAGQQVPDLSPVPAFYDLRPAQAMVVCICGMGPACARAGTEALLQKFGVTSVVTAGAAGAVVDCATVGEVFRVATACLWPEVETMYTCRDDRWSTLLHVVLATVTEPVFDPVRRQEIARHADIVDMEGAAIAQCCQTKGVPLYMIKGVTDQAGANDRERLLRNLDAVSAAVADRLWQELGLENQ